MNKRLKKSKLTQRDKNILKILGFEFFAPFLLHDEKTVKLGEHQSLGINVYADHTIRQVLENYRLAVSNEVRSAINKLENL